MTLLDDFNVLELEELRSISSAKLFTAFTSGDQDALNRSDMVEVVRFTALAHAVARRRDEPEWTNDDSLRMPMNQLRAELGIEDDDAAPKQQAQRSGKKKS